jgi:hypothetical protein
MRTEDQSLPQGQVEALVTVDVIVAEMLNDLGVYTTTEKQRLTGLVIPAIREIRLFHKASIQVAYPKINEAGIVAFPDDLIDYIQIGIPVMGRIQDLGLDNKMLIDRSMDCGDPSREMQQYVGNGSPINFISNNNLDNFGGSNTFTPTWYGSRVMKTAYYKVDEVARQIQFNGRIPNDQIVLVYKSSGISLNTLIPTVMIKPIKAIVMSERVVHSLSVPDNYKERLKIRQKEAIEELRAFTQKFTMAQYKQVLYESKRQTPKP